MKENHLLSLVQGKINFEDCLKYYSKRLEEEIRKELEKESMNSYYYRRPISNNEEVEEYSNLLDSISEHGFVNYKGVNEFCRVLNNNVTDILNTEEIINLTLNEILLKKKSLQETDFNVDNIVSNSHIYNLMENTNSCRTIFADSGSKKSIIKNDLGSNSINASTSSNTIIKNENAAYNITASTGLGSIDIDIDSANSITANTGDNSLLHINSYNSIAANTGDGSLVCAKGIGSAAISSGDHSIVSAESENNFAIGIGHNCIAKGKLGSYLILADWEDNNLIDVKMHIVDNVEIKEDVYYILKNGKFVEVIK